MKTVILCDLSIFFGMLVPATAQPNLPYTYSAASSATYDGTIAPGSLFVVFGQGLGPAQLVKAPAYPLMMQLGGTSIMVMSGATMLACPLFYSSDGVVAAVLPSNTPPGRGMVILTYNGQTAPYPVPVNIVPSAVGVFTLTSSGLGPGIFTALDGTVNTFATTAKNGQTVTAWATGLGATNGPDDRVPSTFPNFPGVEVFVGTQAAHVIYAGRSGCCAAVDQISFEVPAGVTGCFMPVSIRSGGRLSNSVSMATSSDGAACSDAGPTLPSSIVNRALGGDLLKTALMIVGPVPVLRAAGFNQEQYLARKLSVLLHTSVDPKDVARLMKAAQTHNERAFGRSMAKYAASWKALSPSTKDVVREAVDLQQEGVVAAIGQNSAAAVLASAVGGLFPSQGTCAVVSPLFGSTGSSSKGLDAGASLSLSGPAGSWVMTGRSAGEYQAMFGSSPTGPNIPAGTYTLKGTGGKDVPAFTSTLNVAQNVQWTNKSAVSTVDRSQPLTVTWSGGPASGSVLIGGYSDGSSQGQHAFVCVEDSSKGSFNIPAFILSALSPTSTGGAMFIGAHPLSRQVAIPGIDLAIFMDGSSDSRTVGYR